LRTYQLRTYSLEPSELEPFLAWVDQHVMPLRQSLGYTVEFRYADRETGELTWMVSLPGDRSEFEKLDAEYLSSDKRAEIAALMPAKPRQMMLRFVEPV